MRVVKLHQPGGHAYWQAGEYQVEMPDGKFLNLIPFLRYTMGYTIAVEGTGIWIQECACGSGFGKKPLEGSPPKCIVHAHQYDKIEYVGKKQEIPDTMREDLREMNL